MSYIDIKGYNIPLNRLTETELNAVKKELTVEPQNFLNEFRNPFSEKVDPVSYKVYRVNSKKKVIIVPKFWGIKKFGLADKLKYESEKRDISFKGKLRNKQKRLMDKCIPIIKEKTGGLLAIPCGDGKTVQAIYIAHLLGYKTLVLVDGSSILKQWVERINQFTNAKIGIIQGPTFDIEDKDIVIGMVQTLRKKRITSAMLRSFGFLVIDEAPAFVSKENKNALMKTCCNYSLSLSATPRRSDGLIRLLFWFAGDIIHRNRYKVNSNGVVKFINFVSSSNKYNARKMRGGRFTDTVATNDKVLAKSGHRNTVITKILKEVVKDSRRNIIVVCRTICVLEELLERFNIACPDVPASMYIGKMSVEQREEASNYSRVLFASNGVAEKALDIEKLNTVIMGTPLKDPTQCSGRIFRKLLNKGDTKPMVIDIVDHIDDTYIKWRNEREKYYKKCLYKMEDIYCVNTNIKSLEEFTMASRFKTIRPYMGKTNFNDAMKISDVEKDMIDADTEVLVDSDDEDDYKSVYIGTDSAFVENIFAK